MSLTGRLIRRLGFDTTTEIDRTEPVYEYEVLHTNGEKTVFEAHGHTFEGAFAEFYEYYDTYLFAIGSGHYIELFKDTKRTLESIQELSRTKADTVEFRMKVDTADSTVLEKVMVE